jgi:sulfate adenylyltransferase
MNDLIAPHGGLTDLVDRMVPTEQVAEFRERMAGLPRLTISAADLATLRRLGDGGLSPLTGGMDRATFEQVLEEEVIVREGKKYAWTIPLAFPVAEPEAGNFRPGQQVALVSEGGELVGSLTVSDVYPWDKVSYVRGVYGTERMDHPGGRMVERDPRTHLIGGEVEVLPPAEVPEYSAFLLSPSQCRRCFREKGWERVVAFQTRNPLHRAHEYALVVGLERLVRAGHHAGAVLNPLVGETKGDDVDAATRMRTYQALVENKALGQGDIDEELWNRVDGEFSDRVLLIGLDIKMFYGGPKEAIMHAIYRQNFGFTDIIIGRKHADAPFEDGSDIWEALAAQAKFDALKGELLIQPVKVGFAAFYEELGHVGLVEEYAPRGFKAVSISGRELRETLRKGEMPDPRIMRPQTARILISAIADRGP